MLINLEVSSSNWKYNADIVMRFFFNVIVLILLYGLKHCFFLHNINK